MKQLMLVYLWVLSVTVAACLSVSVTEYDVANPDDVRAMATEETLQLILTNDDTLLVSQPRILEDSLVFMVEEPDTVINDQVWRFPKAVSTSIPPSRNV